MLNAILWFRGVVIDRRIRKMSPWKECEPHKIVCKMYTVCYLELSEIVWFICWCTLFLPTYLKNGYAMRLGNLSVFLPSLSLGPDQYLIQNQFFISNCRRNEGKDGG